MAVATLSERAQRVMDSLPGYYWDDPYVLRTVTAVCNELDRAEDFLEAVRLGRFPQSADDTYGLLRNWERILNLQEAPSGVAELSRRNAVLAHRRRNATSGEGWAAAITEVSGGTTWAHTEVAAHRVVVTSAFSAGGWFSGTVYRFARRVTPAHLDVVSTAPTSTGAGFLLGVNLLGDAL